MALRGRRKPPNPVLEINAVKTIIALAVVAMGLWSAYQILPPLVLALKTGTWQARGKS
jgi:hypothetical protein